MKPKQMARMTVDIAMTVALLLLMAYSLIGEAAHEYIGMTMFGLFVTHHILNVQWCKNLFKGKYTAFRTAQTLLVALLVCTMLGSAASGVVLSRHALDFLPISGGRSWARTVHMLSAYWGFVLMSVHLGFHWNMMLGMARRMMKAQSVRSIWLMRAVAFTIAGYGMYDFIKRQIGSYMLLKSQFVFFDFEEPILFFFLDYLAAMGLFVLVGHYLSSALRRMGQPDQKQNNA